MLAPPKLVVGISVASGLLFISSLTQPAYYSNSRSGVRGVIPLLLGWLGGLSFFAARAWLANPFLFAAWILIALKSARLSLACGLMALLIASTFLAAREIPMDESGSSRPITGIGLGYWLWLASMAAAIAASALQLIK
jgi:hypothetical protein